jgi:hypothetical protein
LGASLHDVVHSGGAGGPCPDVTSIVVNGGPIVSRDVFGNTPNLLGQNSVVEQLSVTSNEAFALDAGAFSVLDLASTVSVVAVLKLFFGTIPF